MTRRLAAWIAGAVLSVLILLALMHGWSDLWSRLPWSAEHRLERAEAQLEQTGADLAARRAEVAALEHQAVRTDAAHQTLTQARTITERAATQAETAPDALDEIDPARADRLRDADRRLCALQPDLCPPTEDHPARHSP